MLIHLTADINSIQQDAPYLQAIIDAIRQNDALLAYDWLTPSLQNSVHTQDDGDAAAMTQAQADAIRKADIVIIENSHTGYSEGFQTAVALEYKKPVLVLSRPSGNRQTPYVPNRLLTHSEYSSVQEVLSIVTQFIQENTITTKDLRFNMFIDRPIHNYLRSVSYETGKNKSEIIRDLINREIQKKD